MKLFPWWLDVVNMEYKVLWCVFEGSLEVSITLVTSTKSQWAFPINAENKFCEKQKFDTYMFY